MRKSNTQPIKSVIREYIDAIGHRRKLKEVSIISDWEKLMGPVIFKHTKQIYIKNKTLFVYLDSSVVRNELMMHREKIISLVNEHTSEATIEKVMFR
jgi:predicted nucleic acid-binding Zn ribbon protein